MKSRPILFSAPMVRAILEGRKTQTRRLYKSRLSDAVNAPNGPLYALPSPYGSPGDQLWVKETHAIRRDVDPKVDLAKAVHYLRYRADRGDGDDISSEWHDYGPGWRPSIHMPRWASRITLEITDLRVQRLREITEDDARAEGVVPYTPPHGHISPDQLVPGPGFDDCRLGDRPNRLPFAHLWDEINGKATQMLNDDGEPVFDDNERPIMHAPKSWASNPWVWAITFRRVDSEAKL